MKGYCTLDKRYTCTHVHVRDGEDNVQCTCHVTSRGGNVGRMRIYIHVHAACVNM